MKFKTILLAVSYRGQFFQNHYSPLINNRAPAVSLRRLHHLDSKELFLWWFKKEEEGKERKQEEKKCGSTHRS